MFISPPAAEPAGSSRGWCPARLIHVCAYACVCTGPPCMTRGLLGLGMGAPDWDSTSQLLCLLAEVHAPSTVRGAPAMHEQLRMRATGFINPSLLLFAGSVQKSNPCRKCSWHLLIGRLSTNSKMPHLSLARSLERVTELVYQYY